MSSSIMEAKDFEVEADGVKIEVRQGSAEGNNEAYVNVVVNGKVFCFQADTTTEYHANDDQNYSVVKIVQIEG